MGPVLRGVTMLKSVFLSLLRNGVDVRMVLMFALASLVWLSSWGPSVPG